MLSLVLSMRMHELQKVRVNAQISDQMKDLKTPMKWRSLKRKKKKKFKKEYQDATIYNERKRKRK